MKKVREMALIIVCLLAFVGVVRLCSTYLGSGNWPKRFQTELDQFFGEGSWNCISEEKKESLIYSETIHNSSTGLESKQPGKYKNWSIEWVTPEGETEIWQITNHVLKTNNSKSGFLSKKRLSNKEAFVLELMEIAEDIAADEVRDEVLEKVLTEAEADSLTVSMSYHGGNPKPEFYDKLWKESWFRADTVTAEHFLSTDLYEFFVRIQLYDYRFEQLSEEEQQHVWDSFDAICQALIEQYGEHASFEIHLGEGYSVEYVDGELQEE